MSEIITNTNEKRVRAKSEDGKFYVETIFMDDKALDQNSRIRNSGMLDKGKLGLHDNEDIRAVISCPTVEQWNLFKKNNPITYSLIKSPEEHMRMKGIAALSKLEPAWVVYTRL